jgi:hypothetical protein
VLTVKRTLASQQFSASKQLEWGVKKQKFVAKRATAPAGTIRIELSFISGWASLDVATVLCSLLACWILFAAPFLMTLEMDSWDIARNRRCV